MCLVGLLLSVAADRNRTLFLSRRVCTLGVAPKRRWRRSGDGMAPIDPGLAWRGHGWGTSA